MSNFTDSIDHYCDGLTVATGAAASCSECLDTYQIKDTGDINAMQEALYQVDEPSFSWSQCDSCGSTFGGDRYSAHGIPLDFKPGDDSIIHMEICVDCLCAWANGDEPEQWQQHP